jgi:RNA polymerase sigma factor for flagellar operon FliA
VETAATTYNELASRQRRDELILAHLPLVRHVAGKLAAQLPPGIDLENLESAGVLGLVEAANSYDPGRGSQFKTHAYTRIRGAILDELRRNCPLPQHVLQRVVQVREAYKRLPAPVSVDALAAATGLTTEDVADCLASIRMTRMVSWDASTERMVGTRLDERQPQPQASAEQSEEATLLHEAIGSLPERERIAVTLYYLEDLRLKEIGKVLELSESRVSRVLNAALFHLGETMRAREKQLVRKPALA